MIFSRIMTSRITEADSNYVRTVVNALDKTNVTFRAVLGTILLTLLLITPIYFLGVIIGLSPYIFLLIVESYFNHYGGLGWDIVFGILWLSYWILGTLFIYQKIQSLTDYELTNTTQLAFRQLLISIFMGSSIFLAPLFFLPYMYGFIDLLYIRYRKRNN